MHIPTMIHTCQQSINSKLVFCQDGMLFYPKYHSSLSSDLNHAHLFQIGSEYGVSLKEQQRQVEALATLDQGLTELYAEGNISCHGLRIQLYHPDMSPVESHSFVDEAGNYQLRTSHMKSYVADDGCLHLVADIQTLR